MVVVEGVAGGGGGSRGSGAGQIGVEARFGSGVRGADMLADCERVAFECLFG